MKIIKFIAFFLLFISCDDIGKGYVWLDEHNGFSRRFGTIGYDYGWNAAYSPYDQGIIVVGKRTPSINGQSDLWAIKTDNYGLMKWEKSFGGSSNEEGYDVISTSDGGFLFVGYTWSFGNEQQIYAVKTDFAGNTNWEKTFGGSMWEVGYSVIEVSSGGYIIAGSSNSPGISSGNTDMFLVKIDNNGNKIWEKAYGNPAFPNHEWAYDILEKVDGGFMISGARDRYSDGSVNGLLISIDMMGELIWEKEFPDQGNNSESFYSISKSTDGNYYLCSTLSSAANTSLYQPKIIKIDGSGNIDWERKLSSNSRKYHQFRATSTQNGEVVIVGTSAMDLAGGHKEDAFLTRIDSKGNILWTNAFGSYDEDDWGWSVFETPQKNIVFVGSTKSFGSSLFDIYLVGTNSEGISK